MSRLLGLRSFALTDISVAQEVAILAVGFQIDPDDLPVGLVTWLARQQGATARIVLAQPAHSVGLLLDDALCLGARAIIVDSSVIGPKRSYPLVRHGFLAELVEQAYEQSCRSADGHDLSLLGRSLIDSAYQPQFRILVRYRCYTRPVYWPLHYTKDGARHGPIYYE